MKKKNNELELLFKELNENPYRQYNSSFFLISVIPILSLIYIIFDNLLIKNKNFSGIGYILLSAGTVLICGYIVAYKVIKNIVNKTLIYATKAKRADEIKSDFAMSLAHDLKSPLVTIKANISNLETGLIGILTKEQNEALLVSKETADRMNAMIMELIDTYMIEARIAELKITNFDLRELLQDQERELAGFASTKNITVTLDIPPKPIVIRADRKKILRAVNNLFNNSIKHTSTGGKVHVKSWVAENFVQIEFLNNGVSIPADKLDKIFDKFERINKTTEGQGLGLSIAKDIIELHYGSILVSSKPGKPNSFTVLLPLKPLETP